MMDAINLDFPDVIYNAMSNLRHVSNQHLRKACVH
jgi:hypothetical protein